MKEVHSAAGRRREKLRNRGEAIRFYWIWREAQCHGTLPRREKQTSLGCIWFDCIFSKVCFVHACKCKGKKVYLYLKHLLYITTRLLCGEFLEIIKESGQKNPKNLFSSVPKNKVLLQENIWVWCFKEIVKIRTLETQTLCCPSVPSVGTEIKLLFFYKFNYRISYNWACQNKK